MLGRGFGEMMYACGTHRGNCTQGCRGSRGIQLRYHFIFFKLGGRYTAGIYFCVSFGQQRPYQLFRQCIRVPRTQAEKQRGRHLQKGFTLVRWMTAAQFRKIARKGAGEAEEYKFVIVSLFLSYWRDVPHACDPCV